MKISPKKFRNKILLYFLCSTLVPLLVWSIFVFRASYQNQTALVEHQLQQSAEIVRLQTEKWHSTNQIFLNLLSREIAMHNDPLKWSLILRHLTNFEQNWSIASISNLKGQNIVRSDDRPLRNENNEAYFKRAKKGEIASETLTVPYYQKRSLCSAAPVYIKGRIQYILSLCSSLDQLSKDISIIEIGKTGYALLVDERGQVLAHPQFSFSDSGVTTLESRFLSKLGSTKSVRLEAPLNNNDYVAFISPIANGWRAVALQSKSEIAALSRDTVGGLLITGFVVLLFLIVLTLVFMDYITSPLHRLVETVEKFGQGDLEARAHVESKDELGLIALNFNLMATQIKGTILDLKSKELLLAAHRDELHQKVVDQSQKLLYSAKMSSLGEMAGGIAHEINNPLAIISLKAQRIQEGLGSGRLKGQDIIDLGSQIEATCYRIHKIIRGLRAFSRDGSRDPLVPESLEATLNEAANLCAESIRARGIQLFIEGHKDIILSCQPVQISQVFLNMIMNARDAITNLPEKWIKIQCSQKNGRALIRITDSGSGVPEPIRSQMMQPFFTTKSVGQGTGLGLSICKGIIDHHQGALIYNADCANTEFLISLPLATVDSSPLTLVPTESLAQTAQAN